MTLPNILIVTFGSRGDVEPFLALALRLRRTGHRVAFCTARRFRAWVEMTVQGVVFHDMTDELLALMDSDRGRAVIDGGGVLRALRARLKLAKDVKPLHWQMLLDTWQAAREAAPELILGIGPQVRPARLKTPHLGGRKPQPGAGQQPAQVGVVRHPGKHHKTQRQPDQHKGHYSLVEPDREKRIEPRPSP